MSGTIAFRTFEQLVLWKNEITGQLSDGHWENARPYNHWVSWCNATAIVDTSNVGRDFWAQKDSYGLTSSDLLSVIGDRMCYYLALARVCPEGVQRLLDSGIGLPDSDSEWVIAEHIEGSYRTYFEEKIKKWEAAGLPRTVTPVDMKVLKSVLKEIKTTMKTHRLSVAVAQGA